MSEQSKDQNDIQYVSSKTDKILFCTGWFILIYSASPF